MVQQACQQLGVEGFEDLGFGRLHQVPWLRELQELERRVDTVITAYLSAR